MYKLYFAAMVAVGLLAMPVVAAPAATTFTPSAGEDAAAQGLYIKTFGDRARSAIVFVHGGPGSNAGAFELSAAKRLAEDHYVVIYDQRGCGRSASATDVASYDFAHAVSDLKAVIRRTGAQHSVLLGHSFGGTVGLKFLEAEPGVARGLILASSPIDYPLGLQTIAARCRAAFEAFHNTEGLAELQRLSALDPASAEYAGGLFRAAIFCNLYATWHPTEERNAIVAALAKAGPWLHAMTAPPFQGFIKNERYTTLRLQELVRRHRNQMGGIYGEEDWTLDPATKAFLSETLDKSRFKVLPRASHGVFVDQETAFVSELRRIEATLPP